jgi:F0F1-type ATP synthase delta subunit
VAAIRGAVQGVLEEKAVARYELLMRVTKDTEMSDDERKALSATLEKEFNSKQLLAEQHVTGGLEQLHMKQVYICMYIYINKYTKI